METEFKLEISREEVADQPVSLPENTGVKVPKWFQNNSYSVSVRPHLKIDELDGDGSVLDTVKRRPSQKFQTYKRAGKRLAEMEEWVEYIKSKGNSKES